MIKVRHRLTLRCSMLRVDPNQRNRLIEIIRNLADRIDEARVNGWLGEVQGLQISLDAARAKLISLDRTSRVGASITQTGDSHDPKRMTNSCSVRAHPGFTGMGLDRDRWVSGHQATDQSSMLRERGSRQGVAAAIRAAAGRAAWRRPVELV
jgi:hypothetical protein